ncbi:MAG: dihydrolipoamide acetyltransferase family protein [Proteobacteria bacterium]|nr:dihydrolipoamide acetyltransferase family protein [Pseudomonadota bacterium]
MSQPVLITMPKLSDTMEEGGISCWFVKEGDYIEEGDPLVEIETDKATMEYHSPESGYLRKVLANPGSQYPLTAPIAVISEEKNTAFNLDDLIRSLSQQKEIPVHQDESEQANVATEDTGHAEVAASAAHEQKKSLTRVIASPLAKKLASDHDLILADIQGSGPRGRIIKSDVQGVLSGTKKSLLPTTTSDSVERLSQKPDKVIPISLMRKSIAKSLTASKQLIPHYYLKSTWQLDTLLGMRQVWNQHLSTHRPAGSAQKVSLNDCFIYLVARAVRQHPIVRSFWQQDHILEKGAVHIAMAVALDDGLVTPVIHDADQMSVYDISERSRYLIQQCQAGGKARSDLDLTGGSFTISNLGRSSVDEFAAVINPPQSAILAIGRLRSAPQLIDGSWQLSQEISVTLSCDHRVIDGKEGARFLDTLSELVANPSLALLY